MQDDHSALDGRENEGGEGGVVTDKKKRFEGKKEQ